MINIRKLEAELWESADLLRQGSKLTSSQYCMPVLALLFLRYAYSRYKLVYNPQIQISAESETKRSIFREKDKTKRSKKESAQHSKSRNKSFVMTSVSAL